MAGRDRSDGARVSLEARLLPSGQQAPKPGLRNRDISFQKQFTLDAPRNLQWRAEFFNLANHSSSHCRLALFIEESLYRGLKWAVFEPNDEPLWSQIRLHVGAFLHNLFRQGAFRRLTPREAYFVKCDKETTTQNDRNLGIVN